MIPSRSTLTALGAVLLVALLVAAPDTGLVAAPAGPGPPAATVPSEPSRSAGVTILQAADERFDARIESGRVYWQGQRLYFNGSSVVEAETDDVVSNASTADRTFTVRVADRGSVEEFVREFVAVNATAMADLRLTVPRTIETGSYRLRIAARDSLARTVVRIEVPGGPTPTVETTTDTLTVETTTGAAQTATPTDGGIAPTNTPTAESGPGFGVATALLALASLLAFARRRR